MLEVQSFSKESLIVPEDGLVYFWLMLSVDDFTLLYREILALLALRLRLIEFEEVLVPVIALLDVFDGTDARHSNIVCLQLSWLSKNLFFLVALIMVETWEGFVFLGSRDGDVQIEEVKGRLDVRKSAHEGRRSLRLDDRHFVVIFAVVNDFLLGELVFLVIPCVLEHLVDVKLKDRLVTGVELLPWSLCWPFRIIRLGLLKPFKEGLFRLVIRELIDFIPHFLFGSNLRSWLIEVVSMVIIIVKEGSLR